MPQGKSGLARVRELLAKAASEEDLDSDFEELDAAVDAAPEDDDEDALLEPEADEDEQEEEAVVAKADAQDALPVLQEIAGSLGDILEENRQLRRQNALIAKGLLEVMSFQETLAKSVTDVQGHLDETTVRMPRTGRRSARKAPEQPKREGPALAEVLAKAMDNTELFGTRDVLKLESMLKSGRDQELRASFSSAQLAAVGLEGK